MCAGVNVVKFLTGNSTKTLTANYLLKKKTKQMSRMSTESTSTCLTLRISQYAFGMGV